MMTQMMINRWQAGCPLMLLQKVEAMSLMIQRMRSHWLPGFQRLLAVQI
uniref:Top1 n=1 Tax=Arundo donax TaxID=35708 RepID=A0A0A9GCQ6_ARUDO